MKQLDNRIAVVVWSASQERARLWSESLGAPIYYVNRTPFGSSSNLLVPLRYLLQAFDTWKILMRQRPLVVHVTNPPVFAALVVYLYCRRTGAKYIIDTHSPALYSRKWGWTTPLLRALARPALVNIVDQQRFKELFEAWGARAVILQRPPVNISVPDAGHSSLPDEFSIAVINTFAPDEPLAPILTAAKQLPEIQFFILGDMRYAPKNILQNKPGNVVFTGYLRGQDYWQRLISSNAVMSLTTYAYSLLAGAQDGMMVGRPLILSRQPVLEDYFTGGSVFIENTATGIVEGVQAARARQDVLRHEITDLLVEKRLVWENNFESLEIIVGDALCQPMPPRA